MSELLRYTRHTVAWPSLTLYERLIEEINVTWLTGKASTAEFAFEWQVLGGESTLSIRVFQESFRLLQRLDPVLAHLEATARRSRTRRNATPGEVIELLETQGAKPSHYHLKGLIATHGIPHAERAVLLEQLAAEKKLMGER